MLTRPDPEGGLLTLGFKVIVIGGRVSGLSLANIIEIFNVCYVLLEAHAFIPPKLGTSIGHLLRALRILGELAATTRFGSRLVVFTIRAAGGSSAGTDR